MIPSPSLLQVLAANAASAVLPGGASGAGGGRGFAQELQRATQANTLTEPAAPPPQQQPPSNPSAAAPAPRPPARTDETRREPGQRAIDRDGPAAEAEPDADPQAVAETDTPARKPASPRKARADATKDSKATPSADPAQTGLAAADSLAEASDAGQVRTRKLADSGAETAADGASGVPTPATSAPVPATPDADPLASSDAGSGDAAGVTAAAPAIDPLRAGAHAAAMRRALNEGSTGADSAPADAEGAAQATGLVALSADSGRIGAVAIEGLTSALAPISAGTGAGTGTLLAQPSETRGTAPAGLAPSGPEAAAAALRSADIDGTVGTPAFAESLGARISVLARDGIEQARLNVHPADMGPIAVRLAMDGTQVRIDMTAELGSTRQALEQSLPALASALQDAGFTLAGGGVFQQARDGGGPAGRGDASPRRAEDGATLDARVPEPVRASRAPQSRGLVDLFA